LLTGQAADGVSSTAAGCEFGGIADGASCPALPALVISLDEPKQRSQEGNLERLKVVARLLIAELIHDDVGEAGK
jgi:hypothetical protein